MLRTNPEAVKDQTSSQESKETSELEYYVKIFPSDDAQKEIDELKAQLAVANDIIKKLSEENAKLKKDASSATLVSTVRKYSGTFSFTSPMTLINPGKSQDSESSHLGLKHT